MRKKSLSIGIALTMLFMVMALTPAFGKTKLPESVIGYAWISNPERMLSDADKFIQEMDMPPMASMILKMGLGGMRSEEHTSEL